MDYRVIIAGSRKFEDYESLKHTVDDVMSYVLWNDDDTATFVSGHADGVDKLGERYAKEHGSPCKLFPANWDMYGKTAGFIRTEEMAKFATADGHKGVLIAFYNGTKTGGTKNMIDHALRYEMYVYVVECKDNVVQHGYWKLSNKQDDEYGTYKPSKRYNVSIFDSEIPTGLCALTLINGYCSCENCEGIYCYDKCEGCVQRRQIITNEDGSYTSDGLPHGVLNGHAGKVTVDTITGFIDGCVTEEELLPAFEKMVIDLNTRGQIHQQPHEAAHDIISSISSLNG